MITQPPKIGLLTVDLSHGPNPDVASGYWTQPIDRGVLTRTFVTSLTHASERCRAYIAKNQLGGGNWTGGLLCIDGEPVGRVSYNGRVWNLDDNELTEEMPYLERTTVVSNKFNALNRKGVKRDKKRRLQSARKHRERLVCPEHNVPLVRWNTSFGPRWQCDRPGCTVACWSGTTSSPADDRTRAIRHECHKLFDPLWKNGGMSRDTAYEKLAEVMGMSFKDCHIGMMDYEQCERVLQWLQTRE